MHSIFSPSFLILFLLVLSDPLYAQVTVAISEVKRSDIESELQLTGNIVAQHSVNISSEVSAVVDDISVEAGDRVTKGQELIQLRQVGAELELDIKRAEARSAEAQLKIAQIEERRLRKLLDKNSVSVGSYDQAAAQVQQLQANLAARKSEVTLLEDLLKRRTLRAPFDGVITSRHVERGAWAVIGSTLLSLESLDDLRLELAVPEKYYVQIKDRKSAVKVKVSFDGDVRDNGKDAQSGELSISRILPFADSSRNFEVWVNVDNKNGYWIPGMTAQARLQWVDDDRYPMSVSRDAIVRNANGAIIVWKVIQKQEGDWTGVPIAIKVGNGSGKYVAIKNEDSIPANQLKVGDDVVVRGNESLRPNQIVKPVKRSSSAIN